jgi:LysR family nitrogen assimilation transcriptional regulator
LLDSRRLNYFLRIAEAGSFSRAAIKLGVAQPALSHHIRQLEETLGVKLLVRRSRGVGVTEAGAALLKHARAIVGRMEEAERDLRSSLLQVTGSVHLGLASSVAASLTPLLLREVSTRHPGIVIRIVEGSSTMLAELIATERLDLALNLEGVTQRQAIPLFKEDLYLVSAPEKLGKTRNDSIPFKNAIALPLVLPAPAHSMRTLVDRRAAEQGLSVNVAYEVDGFEPIKAAMRAGLGYSILSWAAIQLEISEHKISARRIIRPAIQRTMVLDSSPGGRSSRAAMTVRNIIVDVIVRLMRDGTWRGLLLLPSDQNKLAV